MVKFNNIFMELCRFEFPKLKPYGISKWLRENRKTDFICQIKKAAPIKALP